MSSVTFESEKYGITLENRGPHAVNEHISLIFHFQVDGAMTCWLLSDETTTQINQVRVDWTLT